jgi:hypothetical protein
MTCCIERKTQGTGLQQNFSLALRFWRGGRGRPPDSRRGRQRYFYGSALVAGVAPGGDALLDVENQHLGAGGPIALGVLVDNFLC